MGLRVSIEQVAGLQRRIRVEVPESGVEAAIDTRLRGLAQTLKLKGFRPGKVPQAIVRQRHGTEIRRQVLQEFLQRICRDAIKEQGFEAVGPARIEQETTTREDELCFLATFEVYPEFQVRGIDVLAIDKPVVTIGNADVDELIQRLRKRQRTWRPVERPSRAGDRVTIDFDGTLDGQPVVGARGERVPLIPGESLLHPDFAARLVGATSGATLAIDLEYPDSFPDDLLRGRSVHYRAAVLEVAEECLAEIGPEFCRGFGIESGAIEDLRAAAEKDMHREAALQVEEDVRVQLLTQLSDATTVELPQMLCDQEISRLQQRAIRRTGSRHIGDIPPPEHFREEAERNVRMGLITRQIFRDQGLRILREEINEKIVASCKPGEDIEKKQNWYAENSEMLAELEHAVIDDKVVAWLLQRATITEKPMAFVEFVDMRDRKRAYPKPRGLGDSP